MHFSLGPVAARAGYRLASYDAIDSTNAEALRRAGNDPGDLWIVAGEQTAGRGRRGRPWQTTSGNLAATLLLVNPVDAAIAATLGFVAGVAVEEAIRACTAGQLGAPSFELRLKWPNDVLLGGAKLAGILLEAQVTSAGRQAVAIGIGVNTSHAPEGLPYPTASLTAAGQAVTAEALFTALSESWVRYAAEWDNGRGFDAIRRRWLQRAAGLGRPISVMQGARAAAGVFETIDESGRLVLRTGDGSLFQVTAGDVHFGAAATSGHLL